MTTPDQNSTSPDSARDADMPHEGDRILDYNRLQLSALMDGEIAPEQARFLLRRLQHDDELAACWSRWHLCGGVLRGEVDGVLPENFVQRVEAAIAAERAVSERVAPMRTDTARARWLRWGGGAALAASVALVALFVNRPSPDAPAATPAQVAVRAPVPAASIRAADAIAPVAPAVPIAPDHTAQLAAAVAVADVPRRALRRSRGQSQRAAIRNTSRAPEMRIASAPAPAFGPANPFAPRNVIVSRPWPRALLPGTASGGAFNVDYGGNGSGSYSPFSPRQPLPEATSDAANASESPRR